MRDGRWPMITAGPSTGALQRKSVRWPCTACKFGTSNASYNEASAVGFSRFVEPDVAGRSRFLEPPRLYAILRDDGARQSGRPRESSYPSGLGPGVRHALRIPLGRT